MAIYKIWNTISLNSDKEARYIESDLSQKEVADLAVGLQFYVEENTRYGSSVCLLEDTVQQVLCTFFGCKPSSRDAWIRYVNAIGGKRVRETGELCSVDLYIERERRCGGPFDEVVAPIVSIEGSPFMLKLRAFYDAEECIECRFVFDEVSCL